MNIRSSHFWLVGLICFCQFATVDAAVTVLRHYRLGEADPGAVAEGVATNSVNSVGGNIMTLLGSPLYSADFPVNAGAASSRSIRFTGTNYGSASIVSDLTNNFGVEVWAKPVTTNGTHYVFYNGHTGGSGWGILQTGTNYVVLFGNVEIFGSAPVLVNQWTHLAVVRDNGTATFYVNGVIAGSTALPPNAPSGSFAIATKPDSPGAETWDGWLDEVRVFTFAPNAFLLGELLFQSSPPVDFSRQGSNFLMTWLTNVSRSFGLEYTTNLPSTNWTKLLASITNGLFTVTDSITDSGRFYRLSDQAGPPCGTNLPPYLPAGFYLLANGSPVTNTNVTIQLDSSAIHTFDASAFVDPSRCDTDVLSWLWTVQQNGSNISAGVSGQTSPVLSMSTNSIAGGNYQLGLDVRGSSGLATNKALDVTFIGKPPCSDTNIPLQLGLSVWRDFPDAISNYYTSVYSSGETYVFQSNGVVQTGHTLFNNRPTNFLEVKVIGEATNCVSDYTYDWQIEVIGGPDDFAPRGVTGYLTPKLTVFQNALPDTQGSPLVDVHVRVTRLSDGKTGDFVFRLIVEMSELSIAMSTDCANATMAGCPTCPCSIEAALPTTEPH